MISAISEELRISLATILGVTVFYLLIAQFGVPGPSSPLGYGLGIIGFVLMLGAEVLYTWRKAQKGAGLGKMRTWLQMHIIIGIVGPYLALLHSAWKLNGLAGVVMLLTFLMVVSGFLVSYIYPSLPRNVEGAELTLPEIEAQIEDANTRLWAWESQHPEAVAALGQRLAVLKEVAPGGDVRAVFRDTFRRWRYQRQLQQDLAHLRRVGVEQAAELGQLLSRRYLLETQVSSLAAARKLLGQARTLHIAVGVVLFALVFVHIVAALYYSALAR